MANRRKSAILAIFLHSKHQKSYQGTLGTQELPPTGFMTSHVLHWALQYWHERRRCSSLHAGLYHIAPRPCTRFVFYLFQNYVAGWRAQSSSLLGLTFLIGFIFTAKITAFGHFLFYFFYWGQHITPLTLFLAWGGAKTPALHFFIKLL